MPLRRSLAGHGSATTAKGELYRERGQIIRYAC
jgi:hypothetical protein